NADRYPAYPARKQVQSGQVVLAWCWAHPRRDLIEAERGRPELHGWAAAWLARLRERYRLDAARFQGWQRATQAFAAADGERRPPPRPSSTSNCRPTGPVCSTAWPRPSTRHTPPSSPTTPVATTGRSAT